MIKSVNKIQRVTIIGAGRRVKNDVLPSFEICSDIFSITNIFAKSSHEIKTPDHTYNTKSVNEITQKLIDNTDVIYIAVPQPVVASVLKKIHRLDVSKICLIIDTPVFSLRYLANVRYLKKFARIVVAEDAIMMPWIPLVGQALKTKIKKFSFEKSLFRYHGLATIKALAGCDAISHMRYNRITHCFTMELANGVSGTVCEPRDYVQGTFVIEGASGVRVTDNLNEHEHAIVLRPIVRDGFCVAIEAGDHVVRLSPEEVQLLGSVSASSTITSLTHQIKRVGLSRMLRNIADGEGRLLDCALNDVIEDEVTRMIGNWFDGIPVARLLRRIVNLLQ